MNGIDYRTTSAYNLLVNGAAERANKTVEAILKELNRSIHGWTDYVPYVQLSYKCIVAELNGSTPFALMFGRPANELENYCQIRTQAGSNMSMTGWKKRHKQLSDVIYSVVKQLILEKKSKMQLYFERSKNIISDDKHPPGAQFMMVDKTRESKWVPLYEGPFTVVRKNRGND